MDSGAPVIPFVGVEVHHVDATQERSSFCPNRVVFDPRARGTEDHDSPIRGVHDRVVSNHAIGTSERDSVRPSAIRRAGGTDFVVLDPGLAAPRNPALEDADGRPTPGIKGPDFTDHETRDRSARFDERVTLQRAKVGSVPIYNHIA